MIKQKISNRKSPEWLSYSESLNTPQTYLILMYHANKEKLCESCIADGWVTRKRTHWTFLSAHLYFSQQWTIKIIRCFIFCCKSSMIFGFLHSVYRRHIFKHHVQYLSFSFILLKWVEITYSVLSIF